MGLSYIVTVYYERDILDEEYEKFNEWYTFFIRVNIDFPGLNILQNHLFIIKIHINKIHKYEIYS